MMELDTFQTAFVILLMALSENRELYKKYIRERTTKVIQKGHQIVGG